MPWVSLTQLTIFGLYDLLCNRFRMKTYKGGRGIFLTCFRGRPLRLFTVFSVKLWPTRQEQVLTPTKILSFIRIDLLFIEWFLRVSSSDFSPRCSKGDGLRDSAGETGWSDRDSVAIWEFVLALVGLESIPREKIGDFRSNSISLLKLSGCVDWARGGGGVVRRDPGWAGHFEDIWPDSLCLTFITFAMWSLLSVKLFSIMFNFESMSLTSGGDTDNAYPEWFWRPRSSGISLSFDEVKFWLLCEKDRYPSSIPWSLRSCSESLGDDPHVVACWLGINSFKWSRWRWMMRLRNNDLEK